VAGEREHIDVVGLHVDGDLADGLDGVGVEEDAFLVADFADFTNWLDDADFVVCVHDGDKDGFVRAFGDDGALEVVNVDEAVGLDGEIGDDVAQLLELLASVRIALCSVTWVMMWLPRSRYISAMPLRARLLDSVAPEVKMISLAVAPMSLAIWPRAISTADSASQPNWWLRLAALPNLPVK
jgi:hypothetical protein